MGKGAESHEAVKDITAGEGGYFIRAWHCAKWFEVCIPHRIQ